MLLANGNHVLIIKKASSYPLVGEQDDSKKTSSRGHEMFDAIRVMKHTIIPHQTEIFVPVKSLQAELVVIEGRDELCKHKQLITANTVA